MGQYSSHKLSGRGSSTSHMDLGEGQIHHTKKSSILYSPGVDVVTGSVGVVTGSVGVVTGSVGVVTGSVGVVTGSVGVVTGSVGVVTGSVGVVTCSVGVVTGSVTGSVGVVGTTRQSTLLGQGGRKQGTARTVQTSPSSQPPLFMSHDASQNASRDTKLSNTSHFACDGHSKSLHGSDEEQC